MNTDFISVATARELVEKYTSIMHSVLLPLEQSVNLILAQDIVAPFDIPGFEQSSMDGYAYRWEDHNLELSVVDEMFAGESRQKSILPGEAMRIFTGAPLPVGADTVIMQEKVLRQENRLHLADNTLKKGSNVRFRGAETTSGTKTLSKGEMLTPAAIGFLAGIGIAEVMVYPMPSVTLIITGNELQKPGSQLSFGQVYESNSYGLSALLKNHAVTTIHLKTVIDELSMVSNALEQALMESDLVIVTGGISAGDHDHVLQATKDCGVEKHFHKVRQRPGRPLYFGTKDKKMVFGLPGNPSSALTCCYQYVLPAIAKMSSGKEMNFQLEAVLKNAVNKPDGLTCFLKAAWKEGQVELLDAQESFRLSSFARANALVELEAERTEYRAGEKVKVLLIQ